jgi:hypothetical protein
MQPSREQSTLAALLDEQRALEKQVHSVGECAADALVVGQAVLAFALREDHAFSALAPLLDPVVEQELADEHQEIAEDLGLLDWLVMTTPDSPDITVLTTSLLRRLRQHIDRDGRLLLRAAAMNR